jgi:hypothetical protein
MEIKNIKITDFATRHFDPKFGGTKILDRNRFIFETELNNAVQFEGFNYVPTPNDYKAPYKKIIDGYADFCKLIVIENFTEARTGTLPITMDNYQYLRSGYSSRTDNELPVFSRWFELPLSAPKAKYLVVVVYTREQLESEYEDLDEPNEFEKTNYEWGVVAILGQMENNEEPMKPITMMRNALGKDEGGSGVPLDREKYNESVDFWSKNANVK